MLSREGRAHGKVSLRATLREEGSYWWQPFVRAGLGGLRLDLTLLADCGGNLPRADC
jgi:hypothetical protein